MSLSVIENVSLSAVQGTVQKIKSFQSMIKSEFTQNHDYGIIPGTKKPTLLKPGENRGSGYSTIKMSLEKALMSIISWRSWA